MLNRKAQRRKGNVVVVVAFSLIAIFGVVAIAVDGGLLQDNRRHVQATVDAAALAAATDMFKRFPLELGKDLHDTAKASAKAVAADNGYNGANCKLTVHIPPETGDHVGEDGYVEVILEYRQRSFFSSVFGHEEIPIRAGGVARGRWLKQNNGIIILDPHAKAALNVHGGGIVNVNGADVIVNSDHAEAASGAGSASLVSDVFQITGGVNSYSYFNGTVNTGVPPTPDPLRSLPPPDTSTMDVRSSFSKSGGSHTIYPGIYRGGIKVSGQVSLTMQPGIYYMDGGGFEFKGQGSLTGNGVMIFNAPQASNDRVYIAGQGAVTLTPMDSGIYKGIVVYQDRNANVPMSIEGNGLFDIRGTFYAASSLVNVAGNGDVSVGAQYISRMLDIGGNGAVNITWNTSLTAPLRQIGLVE